MKLQILALALAAAFGMASGRCLFGKTYYPVGTTIMQSGCRQIVCNTDGRTYYWDAVVANPDKCDTCCVYNDPHISTFDRSDHYNWHGTCRYSLAEYGNEKYRKFAVYGDFKKCGTSPNGPSCVDISSYQLSDDINDVLHVKHPYIFKVSNYDFSNSVDCDNDNPTPVDIGSPYQAFCWRGKNNCMNILGPNLLVTFCSNQVCITTSKEYMGFLGGLCGKYNGIGKDDHTDKSGNTYLWNTNVPAFATSWQVAPYAYTDTDCTRIVREVRSEITKGECSKEELERYIEICKNHLEGFTGSKGLYYDILMSCAEDLCAFPEDQDKWIRIAMENGAQQNAILFPGIKE